MKRYELDIIKKRLADTHYSVARCLFSDTSADTKKALNEILDLLEQADLILVDFKEKKDEPDNVC